MSRDRKYLKTHPWLRFEVNLAKVSPQFWMRLGEARSKCDHVAGVPLRPETADLLHRVYLAKGVMATTAIEGNTLSEEEVLRRVEGKLTLPPSKAYLGQEVDNIIRACNDILGGTLAGEATLSPEIVKTFNKRVLHGLEVDAGTVPGEVRTHSVGVADYRGAPAEDCEYLLERLCAWLNEESPGLGKDAAIPLAIVRAVLAHLYLAWIHPFGDGNGRTARLVEFRLLLAAGVPSPAAHLLSNHYNETRAEYYRQLARSSKSGGDVIPFLEYAITGFVDGLRSQVEHIRTEQIDVAWRNYVHELFREKGGSSKSHERRRHLILDLSRAARQGLSFGDLTTVSTRVAMEYATRTRKTLSRDVNVLLQMGLLHHAGGQYFANRSLIMAFLPHRKTQGDT